jgi:nucleotide-binding universal stress UspA family protein
MAGISEGIVVGYDGSLGGDEALRWAASEARARGTVLTVCHAWAPECLALPGGSAVCEMARKSGEETLARAVRYATSVLGDVRPLLAEGPPAQVLCERSGTAGMTVVGSRGNAGLAGVAPGSVSWQVAAHAQGPVVVICGPWRPVGQSSGPVVVGADGSPASQAAVVFAFEEAALRDVPLVAVCALTGAPGRLGESRQVEEDFEDLMGREAKEHPEVSVTQRVLAGTPRSALLAAAAEAQLLVLGSRGPGGMRLGSVVRAALRHSPCPVAVVHPHPRQPGP